MSSHLTVLLDTLQALAGDLSARPVITELRRVRESIEPWRREMTVLISDGLSPELQRRVLDDLGFDLHVAFAGARQVDVAEGVTWQILTEPLGDWTGRSALRMHPWLCVTYVGVGESGALPGRLEQALNEAHLVVMRGTLPAAACGAEHRIAAVVDATTLTTPEFHALMAALAQPRLEDAAREWTRLGLALAIAGLLDTLVAQESRGSRLRSGQLKQRLSGLQQRSVARDVHPITQMKSIVRRHLGDFERGAKHRLDELVAPHLGPLWQDAQSSIQTLEALEEQIQSRSLMLTVPTEFADSLVDDIGRRLLDAGNRALTALRDQLLLMEQELEDLAGRQGLPHLPLDIPPPPYDRMQRLLAQSIRIDRPYSAQIPRPGFTAVFMEARRELIGVMMFGWLFGPLLGLVFSGDPGAAGATNAFSAGDLLRRGTVGFSIVMVVWLVVRGFAIYRAGQVEHAERMQAELRRARQSLSQELERGLSAFNQAWLSMLSDWLRALEQRVIAVAEGVTREHSKQTAQMSADERHRLQLQVQALEANDRRVTAATKARDSAAPAVRQAEETVVGQLKGAIREAVGSCGLALI